MKPLAILFLIAFSALSANAAITHIYYAISAQGSANGTDCSDAYAIGDATHGINANSGPDVEAHLCDNGGNMTFSYNAQPILITTGGSSGHPYIIHFETGTVMSSPAFSGSSAIRIQASYVTVDGGTNGKIQNTANGYGLTYDQQSGGITGVGPGLTGLLFENLTIVNICQTTLSSLGGCATGGSTSGDASFGTGVSNSTITNMYLSDADTCLYYGAASGDTGNTFSWITTRNCNWEVNVQEDDSGTASNMTFEDMDISCNPGARCPWDNAGGHLNGFMIDPQNGVLNNITIANNFIHDVDGSNITSLVNFDPSNAIFIENTLFYNNILYTTSGQTGPGNGMSDIGCTTSSYCQTYNNTVMGASGAQGAYSGRGAGTDKFYNNIVVTNPLGIFLAGSYSGDVSDYNDFYNLTSGSCVMAYNNFSNCFTTVGGWQSATSLDAHSITTNPNLTAGFALNSGSPAIGAGTNLTSLSIAGLDVGAPATFGFGGACGGGCVSRPASGAWDLGVYPSGSSPPPASTGTYHGLNTYQGLGTYSN